MTQTITADIQTAKQQELLETAKQFLAGGGLGHFRLPDEVDIVLASASGSHMTDTTGREYIDYVLGSGPMLIGHANPTVIGAAAAQIPKGTTYFLLNEPAIRLAKRLVENVPCGEQVRFQTTGTEATHVALRGARAYTGRGKILKFEGGWHGMHDYSLWGTVPSVPSEYPRSLPDSRGIPASVGKEVLVAPFNETERAVKIIEDNASDLAAVIVEPLERVLVPEPGFLEAIREVTARHGIVLVFDEVVTGFRIAWGGAQERYGVVPDIATYGKAMAGGFPLAAVVGRADIMQVFNAQGVSSITDIAWASGTFNGNPVAASAGLAALDILEQPESYQRLHSVGSRLRAGIAEAGRRHGFPAQALGEDAVFGIRFIESDNVKTWMDLQAHDTVMGRRWAIECIKRGLLMIPNEKIYISIAHTDEDVDRTLQICDDAFRACAS